jgi:hypothetical protein
MNLLFYAGLFVLLVAAAGFWWPAAWVRSMCLILLLAYSTSVWLFWNVSIRAHVKVAQNEGRSAEFIDGMIAQHGNARGDGFAALLGALGLGLLVVACMVRRK